MDMAMLGSVLPSVISPVTASSLLSKAIQTLSISPTIDRLLNPYYGETSAGLKDEIVRLGLPLTSSDEGKLSEDREGAAGLSKGTSPPLPSPLASSSPLSPGMILQGIIELVGEAGAGKTQFALTVAVRAALPIDVGGLGGDVLWINTEDRMPTRRLQQIADDTLKALQKLSFAHTDITTESVMNHIHIVEAADSDDLEFILKNVKTMIPKHNIKIVVVDSMAAIYRAAMFENNLNYATRAASMFRVSSALRALQVAFGVGVLVTNQVTDDFVEDADRYYSTPFAALGARQAFWSDDRRVRPALGLSFEHCCDTRLAIAIRRSVSNVEDIGCHFCLDGVYESVPDEAAPSVTRMLTVLKSPAFPDSSAACHITAHGVT